MKKAVWKQVRDANFLVVRKTLITFTIAMSLGFSSTIANAQDVTTDPSPVVEAEVIQTEQTTQTTTSDATVTGSDEAKSSSSSRDAKPEAPAAPEAKAETTSDESLVAEKPEVDPSSQIKDQLSSSKLSSKDEKSADKDKANKTEDKSEFRITALRCLPRRMRRNLQKSRKPLMRPIRVSKLVRILPCGLLASSPASLAC